MLCSVAGGTAICHVFEFLMMAGVALRKGQCCGAMLFHGMTSTACCPQGLDVVLMGEIYLILEKEVYQGAV